MTKEISKTRNEGITLIALIITIIVMLILVGVTVTVAINGGLFGTAEDAVKGTKYEQDREILQAGVLGAINTETLEIPSAQELKNNLPEGWDVVEVVGTDTYTATSPNNNVFTVDKGGNVTKGESTTPGEDLAKVDGVKIPKDFIHIAGNTREEGIVVADASGNFEYVWIPVTKDENGNPTQPYVATNGELNGKVIQLQRTTSSSYKEETADEHTTSGKENAIAEDITAFKNSVIQNGGYFLGRYEAGIEGGTLAENPSTTAPDKNYTYWTGGTLVCKAGQQVYNWTTQNKASELCKNIDNNYTGVTSDLVNSYAWDTAIVFIQACGRESNSRNYARQSGESKDGGGPFETGTAVLKRPEMIDKQCNIYDMSGNCYEWSTETCSNTGSNAGFPCVHRGGPSFSNGLSNTTGTRLIRSTTTAGRGFSFRPLLYWNS